MLDLFSGLGGASAAMQDRGWRVVSVEIQERFKPTVVGDVTALPISPFPVDLLWASPPCEMYSAKWQFGAWHPNAPDPDLRPWQAVNAIIEEWQPRFWCIENVRAAQKAWGKATVHFGGRYLWTNLPMIGQPDRPVYKMGHQSGAGCKARGISRAGQTYSKVSKIEYVVSEIVAAAVESLTEAAA